MIPVEKALTKIFFTGINIRSGGDLFSLRHGGGDRSAPDCAACDAAAVPVNQPQQKRKHPRINGVIRINEGHIVAGSRPQPFVSGTGYAAVLLMDHPDIVMLCGQPVTELPGVIPGAVVDQENFRLHAFRRKKAVDAGLE